MPHSGLTSSPPKSTAKLERVASLFGGMLLLAPLVRRRSLWRWSAAAAGGALIYNGVRGAISVPNHFALSGSRASRINIRQSITIGRSAAELSAMWRSPDVMTRVMQPFRDVEILGTDHLRWNLNVLGTTIEVECTLAEERTGELVHWKATPASLLRVDERMHFRPAPQGRGTEATLEYDIDLSRLPAGATVRSAASFFDGAARVAIRKVLHNFKSLAETGEVPTLERNSSARANGKSDGDLI